MTPLKLKNPVMLQEAAETFGISAQWLRRSARKGKIAAQLMGHIWFLERDEVTKLAPDRRFLENAMRTRQRPGGRKLKPKK